MQRARFVFLFCLGIMGFGSGAATSGAIDLRFLYHQGDQFRFYGVSQQIVNLNGQRVEGNLDTYRISFKVAEATQNDGRLTGETLYTSQRSDSQTATQVEQSYPTDFRRDDLGRCTVPDNAVLPVVRGVPTFAGKDIQTGDTWAASAEEVEDLSDIQMFNSNGTPLPLLHVPIQVSYKYLGEDQKDGKTLQLVQADYTLFLKTPFTKDQYNLFPVVLTGYSHQKIWFDAVKGREDSYEEDYSLVLTLSSGDVYEFTGQSHARLVDAKEMDKPKLVDEVKKGLAEKGLADVQVRPDDKGVVINLDNIRFPADSAELVPSEQDKLRLIGEVLKRYPDRDILVEGYTALAGTPEDRLKLSQNRAAAVGDYLVSIGVRKPEQINYRGWGAEKPLAPNDTEENMKKNRRVEITILEN